MKKIIFIGAFFLLVYSAKAQRSDGVNFVHGLTWNQIKARAKTENKLIFVDCYATWCGPCKQMDAEVYPNPQVGSYMNDKFISVKIQMDKTKDDNQEIKDWYSTANNFNETYHITSLPTFLYFSSDGKPIHRVSGSGSATAFIQWAKDAQNPQKQYYALLKDYRPGILDTAELRGLALANRFTDATLAGELLIDYLDRGGWETLRREKLVPLINGFATNKEVSRWVENIISEASSHQQLDEYGYRALLIGFKKDSLIAEKALAFITRLQAADLTAVNNFSLIAAYSNRSKVQNKIDRYLSQLNENQLLQKANLDLAGVFIPLSPPKDKLFKFFLNNGRQIDQNSGIPDFAAKVVDAALYNACIYPVIKSALDTTYVEPDWKDLYLQLAKLTNSVTAKRNLINGKINFYRPLLARAEAKEDKKRFEWGAKLSKALVEKFDLNKPSSVVPDLTTGIILNNDCWPIFQYSEQAYELRRAAAELKPYLTTRTVAGVTADTYANLQYKLGHREQALTWEKKAMADSPEDMEIKATYEKMEQGKPTWPVPEN